jgi:hypothetical protein
MFEHWANFYLEKIAHIIGKNFRREKIGWATVWAIFVVIGLFFTKASGHSDFE